MAPRSIRPHASRHCLPLHLHESASTSDLSRDTRAGTAIWSDRFEGQAEDLFELQDELSARVVATIAPQVQRSELKRVLRKRPESLDAYECVVRGMDLLYYFEAGRQEEALPFCAPWHSIPAMPRPMRWPRPATLSGSTRVA